jgi:peptidyl-prolyl cis-trans isomerase SurA
VKKIIILTTKLIFSIITTLLLILFIYSAFFYKSNQIEQDLSTNINQEEKIDEKQNEEDRKIEELDSERKISEQNLEKTKIIEPITTIIKDGLYVTVGNIPVTKSDIVDEIKIILILNNMTYSDDMRESLQQAAVKSTIERSIKEIEIEKNDFLEFSKVDFNLELERLAARINMDVETLKEICKSNEIDFSSIESQVKTQLLWNSLIFLKYRSRISINLGEIDEQLKKNTNKKEFYEYLISEIIIPRTEEEILQARLYEIKNKIIEEGFANVAINESISESASKGGDLGWVNENEITKDLLEKIVNTSVGNISEPIFLNQGILIYKVRDKKKKIIEVNLEKLKNQLVTAEKEKVLKMYSMSHYDSLRRLVSIKFYGE